MKKLLLQRLFIALCVAALPLYAIADYTATQGGGTTVFAFTCSGKVCPAHTLVTSSGVEIMSGASPGFVTISPNNVTVSGTGTFATQSVVTQGTAANLNATVVGTGSFAAQINGFTSWAGSTLGAIANYGTSPGAVLVPGVNSFVTNTVTISPSNVFAVTVSGGATAANQATEIGSLATIATNTGAAIPAGTNVIGALTGATSGGFTTLTMTNLLTTVNSIKASAGQLVKLYCYNPNASVAYIQVFNVASGSVTLGTTKPSQTYGIPATNAAGFAMSPVGDQYLTAIAAAATTTATGLTPPAVGIDCNVSFF